jgi:hypothetical protein
MEDGLRNNRGYPQMVPLISRKGSKLTEEWQRYMMDVQCLYFFGSVFESLGKTEKERMVRWFSSMFGDNRFLTNNAGVTTRYNVFTGTNSDAGLPMAQEVVCAVNVMELDTVHPEIKSSVACYRVKTLDGNKPPPDPLVVNYETDPSRIHVAVTWIYNDKIATEHPEERFYTGNFPQMENVGYYGFSLYPNISPGGVNWVATSRATYIKSGGRLDVNHFEI